MFVPKHSIFLNFFGSTSVLIKLFITHQREIKNQL